MCAPPQHSPPRRKVPKSLLKSCLKLWQSQGGITKLWWEIEGVPTHPPANSDMSATGALHWARLGRLGNAIKALSSSGVANPEDSSVQPDILKHHQFWWILIFLTYHLPSLLRLMQLALKALKVFPKDSSLGGFQLWAQHLLNAVSGFTTPVAQDCLHQLICLVNFLLSGKAPHLVPPWVCGALLTALYKKSGGVCPIAVCKTIRRLVSFLCSE